MYATYSCNIESAYRLKLPLKLFDTSGIQTAPEQRYLGFYAIGLCSKLLNCSWQANIGPWTCGFDVLHYKAPDSEVLMCIMHPLIGRISPLLIFPFTAKLTYQKLG